MSILAPQEKTVNWYPSPRPSRLLEVIEEVRREGGIDEAAIAAMRWIAAPVCASHQTPTVVLKDGKPCCARCWKEAP